MAELQGWLKEEDQLTAARDLLRSSIAKSKDIASAINQVNGPRLQEMNQRLPSLQACIKTIARKCDQFSRCHNIHHAVGPAAALLTVFHVVHHLHNSLLAHNYHHNNDDYLLLTSYISTVKRLEEALRLLTDNCKLVITWLEDVLILLENTHNNTTLEIGGVVADDHYDDMCWYHRLANHVNRSLKILRELQATDQQSRLNGGLLNSAFNNLENGFRHLLTQNTFPISFSNLENETRISFPLPVIQKLQCILERLAANNRLQSCISIYVEVRTSNARATLQDLNLDYLKTSLSELDSVQSIEETCIGKWSSHLEFVVKHLLELEHRLCIHVFEEDVGLYVSQDCFAKIALQCGLQAFIKFANTIAKTKKKEAIKLFRLLDIFAALDKLRLDFNRLFGGQTCVVEVQTQTRDLIKNVVNGACEIFWELCLQVELQRQSSPPSDGSVPRLVSFVMDYSNQLLSDYYRPTLTQVLEIHWSWNHDDDKFKKQLVFIEVQNIVKAIELNLRAWARTYQDCTLSYLFLINNHWYLRKNLEGTKIGELMGDSWLGGHEDYLEYYTKIFMRETWGKLPPLLNEEGLILFSGGTTIYSRDLVKRRIKAFTEAFEDIYRKQSSWVVSDQELRWNIRQLVVRVSVPVYNNFMQNYYVPLVEKEASPGRYVKHSAESLENMLSSVFQPKLDNKYGSSPKCTHLIGKIKNVVTNHFSSSTPAAA